MLISAPGASRSDTIRDKIVKVIKAWVKNDPVEVAAFKRMMEFERDARSRDIAAVGENKELAKFGEIPASLYHAISTCVGSPHWHNDPKTRAIFWSEFQEGKIRRGARLPTRE